MPFTPQQIAGSAANFVDKPLYQAEGAVTKCNFYVRDVVEEIVQQSRPELEVNDAGQTARANDQFDNLKASAAWTAMNLAADVAGKLQAAHDAANAGTLVIIAYKNPVPTASGHIAIVVPAPAMEASAAWTMSVPFIAQAGKINPRNKPAADPEATKSVFAALKMSWAFKVEMVPNMELFYFND